MTGRFLRTSDLARAAGVHENTVRRYCGRAKQFFRYAVRKRLITESPFADMAETSVRANRNREHFISRDVADAVLTACPDAEWKLIFALSRYGGLRCPSEHLGLRWSDIDWGRGRIVVRSPKTELHEGKEFRVIPLFPELQPYLQAVHDEVRPGFDVPGPRSGHIPPSVIPTDANSGMARVSTRGVASMV